MTAAGFRSHCPARRKRSSITIPGIIIRKALELNLQRWLLSFLRSHFYLLSGEVVGGYSFPDSDELLYGGVYAIDGRTMEDVKGLTYPEWIDQWTRKYGELK